MSTVQDINGAELGEFLTSLYGLEISVANAADASYADFGALATYVDGEENVAGYILCDLPAAAMLGGALTQIPVGGVEDAIAAKEVPANLAENIHEVLNISVNIFPGSESRRIVLKDFTTDSSTEVPSTDNAVAFDVDVQRYGKCKLLVVPV